MPHVALSPTASLDLPDSWIRLPTTPAAIGGADWTRWAEALVRIRGDDDGFDWMDGLVDPDIQAASQQALEAFAPDTDELEWPDEAIAELLERAATTGWPLTVVGCTTRATMLWVLEVRPAGGAGELSRDEHVMDRVFAIAAMTPGGGGPGPEPEDGEAFDPHAPDAYFETCHDLAGWVDWGFVHVSVRTYDQQGLAVIAISHDVAEMQQAFGALRCR